MQDLEIVLNGLNNGGFLTDCNQRFAEVVKAVEENGGIGGITLKLKIERNEDGTASISPEVSVKRPYRKRPASLFFLHNGGLHKEDPRQLTLADAGKNVRNIEDRRLNTSTRGV